MPPRRPTGGDRRAGCAQGHPAEHLDLARYTDRTDISDDQFQYMVETVGDQVRQFASTEGWFDPVTKATVEGEGDKRVVHISVDPGAHADPRRGRAGDRPGRHAVAGAGGADARQVGLPVGEPFRQSAWDKAKEDALAPEPQLLRHMPGLRAQVEPDEQAADLSARYERAGLLSSGRWWSRAHGAIRADRPQREPAERW
jgi:translocation and assembly module TamA